VLRELRVRRKLTRPQAAALIGCHPNALVHLERETRGASDVMLQKIADGYSVRRETLMKTPGGKRKAAA
jgi:transcriptional regulator with XRE-family HTH domain